MLHYIAVQLVTPLQTLHGSKQVQEKHCHTVECYSLKTSKGMNQAAMNALHGMALGTTAPTPVQLMYTVSNIHLVLCTVKSSP